MQIYSEFRSLLLNQSELSKNTRQEISEMSNIGTIASAGIMGVSAFFTVTTLVTAVAFPILGTLGVLFFGSLALISHETMAVLQNTYELLTNDNLTGYVNTAFSVISPTYFVDFILKDTWIAKHTLSNVIVWLLNQDKSELDWLLNQA